MLAETASACACAGGRAGGQGGQQGRRTPGRKVRRVQLPGPGTNAHALPAAVVQVNLSGIPAGPLSGVIREHLSGCSRLRELNLQGCVLCMPHAAPSAPACSTVCIAAAEAGHGCVICAHHLGRGGAWA